MSRVYTDPQHYADIADAIRVKLGTEEQYTPAEMAEAILAIETDPVIEQLAVDQNGTYIVPEGVDGYSPVYVSVTGGERNADIHWYAPRVCLGDPQVTLHSDCEMKDAFTAADYEKSDNILSLSRTDKLNILALLDTDNIEEGDTVSFTGKFTIYQYFNGSPDPLEITVMPLLFTDIYEPFDIPSYGGRKILPRMRVIRNNVKMDSGSDTVNFTGSFPGVGVGSAPVSTVVVNADSYVTAGGLQINVNQRDAAVYYVWAEEGECEETHFLKVRWKGASHYSQAVDHEWEVILLGNGDVILRLISQGSYSGTFTFKGITYQPDITQTVCFYRKDFYGTSWDILTEEYTIEHHHPEAENLYSIVPFADVAETLTDGTAYIDNVGYDDNAYTFTFDPGFTWHGKTNAVISGNSWMGIGASAENIRMHRRDSKMWYLYGYYAILTDMGNMKGLKLSWRGASQYSGSIDRWWTLWLFENGDAMIYISTIGANTGTCDFFGQTYTGANNSCISFYYDSTAGNYDIKYERYTLEHHIG